MENYDFDLWEVENDLHSQGYEVICGIDEAGRGPLAGPVCAAAVILPQGLEIPGLTDSKKLTEKRREALYDVIIQKALAYGVAFAEVREIEELNILNATFLAMSRAVEKLGKPIDLALIDGNRGSDSFDFKYQTVVKGDARCASIAAASILAKVTRDRYMAAMAKEYPQYGFEVHKGYGTKRHYMALLEHGLSPIHRPSFLKNLEDKRKQYGQD